MHEQSLRQAFGSYTVQERNGIWRHDADAVFRCAEGAARDGLRRAGEGEMAQGACGVRLLGARDELRIADPVGADSGHEDALRRELRGERAGVGEQERLRRRVERKRGQRLERGA